MTSKLIRSLRKVTSFSNFTILPVNFCGSIFLPLPGDHVYDGVIKHQTFENNEIKFIQDFLVSGQTFWDIGANFGLYTLLAAQRVGKIGKVLSIEPEPRNNLYLRTNLLLNRQWNVKTLSLALGKTEKPQVDFLSCSQGAYSSLKVAKVPGSVKKIKVRQSTLDVVATELNNPYVDFIKMDVEGAEILVLEGGIKFFSNFPRPILMCELSDRRTSAFGYQAKQIYSWLENRNYKWFRLEKDSRIQFQVNKDFYDYDNLIACPLEKIDCLSKWINQKNKATTSPNY